MRIMIRPAAGLKVRDNQSMQILPDEGKEVVWSSYWERRLIDGDVVLVKSAEDAKAQQKNKMGDK